MRSPFRSGPAAAATVRPRPGPASAPHPPRIGAIPGRRRGAAAGQRRGAPAGPRGGISGMGGSGPGSAARAGRSRPRGGAGAGAERPGRGAPGWGGWAGRLPDPPRARREPWGSRRWHRGGCSPCAARGRAGSAAGPAARPERPRGRRPLGCAPCGLPALGGAWGVPGPQGTELPAAQVSMALAVELEHVLSPAASRSQLLTRGCDLGCRSSTELPSFLCSSAEGGRPPGCWEAAQERLAGDRDLGCH